MTGLRSRGMAVRRHVQDYGLVLVLIVLVAAVAVREPTFIEGQNLLNVLQQWAPIGLMAVAGTFVIIGRGFDFSVGGVYALGAVLFAGLAQSLPVSIALGVALAAGTLVGVINGLVVTKARVNPFIATLGMGQVARGLALVYSGGAPFVVQRDSFLFLGTEEIGPVAISTVIMVSAFVAGAIILHRTIYGRTIFAIGGNPEASRLSGINVDRRLIAAYAASGFSAALAGLLVASRLGVGQADAGVGIEFDVIIAIVLGGTAIGGGFGAMWRTGVGLALLAVMQNGLDSLQVNPFVQVVIKGAVLITAVAWDEYVRRHRAAAGDAEEAPP